MVDSIKDIMGLIQKDRSLIGSFDKAFQTGKNLNLSGMCEQEKGYIAASLGLYAQKKPVFIAADSARARYISQVLAPFADGDVVVLQPSEMSLISAVAASRDSELDRCGTIAKLYSGDFGAAVICAGALLNKHVPVAKYAKKLITVKINATLDPSVLSDMVSAIGYERVSMVEHAGEFSWRGEVFDIFTPDMQDPVRISFFDDDIERIRTFNLDSQRSNEDIKRFTIIPAAEIILEKSELASKADAVYRTAVSDANDMKAESRKTIGDLLLKTAAETSEKIRQGFRIPGCARWTNILIDNPVNILEYIDFDKCFLVADEISDIKSRTDSYAAEFYTRFKGCFETGSCPKSAMDSIYQTPEAMKAIIAQKTVVALACLPSMSNGLPNGIAVTVTGMAGDSYRSSEERLAGEIKGRGDIVRFVLMVTGKQRTDAFVSRLSEFGASIEVIDAPLPSGFVYPAINLQIIGEQDVFGAEKKISGKKKNGQKITFFGDLTPGDYVVHDAHGIGRYEGLVNMKVGDSSQDYLKISYAKEAVIYITVESLGSIQKYVGPGGKPPKLSNLDSQEWHKAVEKTRSSVKTLAYDLVKLYAARRANKGYSCEPDDSWQKQFEESFPFAETEDQLSSIRDIKADMESDVPMDRLLCGDVGFGKTEVAFRAIFKAVMNGKKAMLLAPTTLLAQQHYENFCSRTEGFPIRSALLSRMVQSQVMKQILSDVKEGKIDVLIGTHRILSNDVKVPDLGLLVIDEEQRFGVNHKEKIKALKTNIDVLTLTATPIPRTLHMSLSGIRDISVLEEPPLNRRPVQTYVMEYNEEVVVQACMREIARHGQIFYMYNRTADIDKKADELQKLMPNVRITYAHGKMPQGKLEEIIEAFIAGKYDILVCTTIIESGVDMPNVNTIVVEESDRFGLAQLYQIKGRVGRSDRQAYAYMTYKPDKDMNDDARKRLMAIREFTELGSGIKIAMKDLEVRGAGNLLGAEQHGQMEVIGYELYCRLLDEAIHAIREDGDKDFLIQVQATVEMDFDCYIPTSYISDDEARMAAYRRIAAISSREDYDDVMAELDDRYGDAPNQIWLLSAVSLVRTYASKACFEKVKFSKEEIDFYFSPEHKIDMEAISRILGTDGFAGHIQINGTGKPCLQYTPIEKSRIRQVEASIRLLEIYMAGKENNSQGSTPFDI